MLIFGHRMAFFFSGSWRTIRPIHHAHLHIVQNAAHGRRLWNAAFMPLWPHPNLIPRDPARSDRFENVCFFGDPSNLARELTERRWQRKLKDELDVEFVVCGADRWHDYSEVDCVVAVRGFGRSRYTSQAGDKTIQCLAGWGSLHRREGFGLRGGRGTGTELSAGVNP